jgi:3-hydroxyisobutyrate dehydrogenase
LDRLCEKGGKKMRVGFVGLGNLGKAIVDRMISQGLGLYVYNRTIEKAKNYNYYENPNQLFKNSDVIFIIIRDSNAVEELLFREIDKENLKDKIIIDMTTNSYQFVIYAYNKIKNLNGYYFEAPLLGSVPAAQSGNLVMLIYGDIDKFKKIEDIIKTFTRKIFYFDELGKPTKIKLLNNFALAGISHSIIETITIAQKLSIEKEVILDVLLSGAGRSYFLEIKKDKILNENFQPQFSIELLHKDLNYFFELINQFHIYSHILEPINKILKRAINLGYGNLDISAIYLVLKEKIFNDERFIEGIKLFQEGKFFEAHEVLEELWREIPNENKYRNFIKALIQISAGYYKYIIQKNKDGAIKIFNNTKNYLLEYQDEKTIFNVKELVRNIEFLIELIKEGKDISSFKVI